LLLLLLLLLPLLLLLLLLQICVGAAIAWHPQFEPLISLARIPAVI